MGVILSNPKPPKPVLFKGKAYTEFKRRMYKRANECCETCGKWLPLLDQQDKFDLFSCAHLSHIRARKKYGDVSGNVKIECWDCHISEGHLKWRSDKK